MSNKDKYVGYRTSIEMYAKIKEQAKKRDIRISDFLRHAVEQCLTNDRTVVNQEFDTLKQQIEKKDEQIEHLHQLLAMEKQNMASITQQLEKKELLLEDLRNKSVWSRLKGAFFFISS